MLKIFLVDNMESLYKGFFTLMKDYTFNKLSYNLDYPLVKPWRVNFDITHRCPFKCVMCNVWIGKIYPKKELKVDELRDIIDQIDDWEIKHISFAGGETLVRAKDVVELIKYASQKNMRTDLITNGYFLDEKLCRELLIAKVSKISLSVDGAKRKTHDSIRGKGNFDRVMKVAKILKKLKEDVKSKVELEFTTVIMSYNFRELVDIFNLMKKTGFDYINYQAVVPDNTFKSKKDSYQFYKNLWINEKNIPELKEVVRKLLFLKKTGKIRNTREYLLLVPKYFEKKQNFRYGKCIVGYSYFNIDPYGNVNICGLGPNLNIRDDKIKNLWKSEKYKQTRILIKKCKRPCLMLCYEKIELKEFIKTWMELRGWI
jgi:MoaA/NifB/PqqE/SkfB family radical SAM enzyme